MSTIKATDFSKCLNDLLKNYVGSKTEKVNRLSERTVKRIAEITRRTAPKKTGDFKKGIRSGLILTRATGNVYAWYVADPEYRLTHLLVHGHRTVNGKRTKSNPFLANAVDETLPEYVRSVENSMKEGS